MWLDTDELYIKNIDIKLIEDIKAINNITNVEINKIRKIVKITYDSDSISIEEVIEKIEKLGYSIKLKARKDNLDIILYVGIPMLIISALVFLYEAGILKDIYILIFN